MNIHAIKTVLKNLIKGSTYFHYHVQLPLQMEKEHKFFIHLLMQKGEKGGGKKWLTPVSAAIGFPIRFNSVSNSIIVLLISD